MPEKNSKDIVRRGEYGFDPVGAVVFCGLRGLDPFLQHYLLKNRPLDNLVAKYGWKGPEILLSHPSHPGPRFTVSPDPPFKARRVDGPLNLSPYQLGFNLSNTLGLSPEATVLWSMSLIAASKHIYTFLFTSQEIMGPGAGVIVGAFNATINTINSLLFTLRLSNPTYTDPSSLYIGAALFTIGILVEPIAETQRYLYKKKNKSRSSTANTNSTSKSKPYTGGLFGLARNINYGAYVTWRTGFALAGGGWVWAAIVFGYGTYQFANEQIPMLEDYMRSRYGQEEWNEVERKVKYRLFPGIY